MYKYLGTRNILRGAILAAVSGTVISPVVAQEAGNDSRARSGGFLEEVIVTARKKEESLQDIPIAVTAFTGNQLRILGANESGDVALYTPNFTWNTEFGRASPQPFLRGVGSNGFMPNNVNPIAVYSDHVLIGPNVAQGFAAFDIDRVEVLKGPQGTLYGRNSTGGLINFISVQPTIGDGTSGHGQVEAGSFDTFNTELAVEADLSDTVAARLSLASNRNTGLFDNENLGGNSGKTDDIAGRLQVLIEPSDRTSILLNGHFGLSDPDVAPFKAVGTICPPGVTVPNLDDCVAGGGADSTDLFTVNQGPTFEGVDTSGVFVKIEHDFGNNLTLNSITAYDTAKLKRLDDVDDLGVFQENDRFWDDFKTFSQELRLSGSADKIDWHVGAYYYNEEYDGEFIADFVSGSVGNIKEIDTESVSVFGQVEYDLSDRLGVSAGLRYTYESKDVDYFAFFGTGDIGTQVYDNLAQTGVTYFESASASNSETFNNVSGRLSLDYAVGEDLLVYASYSRGFKAGDVNGLAFSTTQSELAAQSTVTDPEVLDAFEIGFKGTFADGAVRLNGALFYYDYQDQQQSVLLPVPGFALPVPVTSFQNASESQIPGAELELTWEPAQEWLVIASVGWVDAEYDDFVQSDTNDFSGNRIPLTPEVEATVLVSKDFPMNNGGYFSVQANGRYQSDNFFQPTNEPGLSEDAQTVFGLRAAYMSPDDVWEFALNAKNITDKSYFVAGFNFDVPGVNSLHLKTNTPRLITGSVRVNF
jgi:iron complex outermembrane receptor protein